MSSRWPSIASRPWCGRRWKSFAEGRPTASFDVLQEEIQPFTREPSGVGFDVPAWLEVLEAEVFRIRSGGAEEDETGATPAGVPLVRLPLEAIQKQIAEWDEDPL